MNTLEVYASNIQKGQMNPFLDPCQQTEEEYNSIRTDFLNWLVYQEKHGVTYNNQVDAWFWFSLRLFREDEIIDDEELQPWEEELMDIFEKSVKLGNYNEYGGQL